MVVFEIACAMTVVLLASTDAYLRKPPTITIGPLESIVFRLGDGVTLDCKTEGIPDVNYTWRKNGDRMDLNSTNIHRGSNGTITIRPTNRSDEGFYQCYAENEYGVAVSNTSHLRSAFLRLRVDSNSSDVRQIVVSKGQPFRIPAVQYGSLPKALYKWEAVMNDTGRNESQTLFSKRIQMADNGDLHFGYAKHEDDGLLLFLNIYNPVLNSSVWSNYTNIKVTNDTGDLVPLAPKLGFSSPSEVVAFVGGNISLRCFFYGYPEPSYRWSGPGNTLPIGRNKLKDFDTEIVLTDVRATDEGDYVCSASSPAGQASHNIRMRVEAAPKFEKNDWIRDVTVTEGDSHTFSCYAFAIPAASITWYQNGKPIDVDNPPKRFGFNSDRTRLSIKDICLSCSDRDSRTDITVIQCNASNIHGYAFRSGYLNVIKRTVITPPLTEEVGVKYGKVLDLKFECNATTDPNTPLTVRWYKVSKDGDHPVDNMPPQVTLMNGTLILNVAANSTKNYGTYAGEYKCIAHNGFSRAEKKVKLMLIDEPESGTVTQSRWWIYLVIAIVCILLVIFGVCIAAIICKKRKKNRGHLDIQGDDL